MTSKRNAIIIDAQLGASENSTRGILMASLTLDYGDSSQQSTPGYRLTVKMIEAFLNAARVEDWSQLKGKPVIALFESDDYHAPMVGISDILGRNEFLFADNS